ncbi:hypothetical protein E2C01_045512 [Portunus trituberculatus]|jgi:hypothetical protein
MIPL